MTSVAGRSGQYWSGFSPSNVPGLALWYDFLDTTTFDLSGDYVITRVRDKSGQGRHGTPSNAAGANWIYDGIADGAFRAPGLATVNLVFDVSLNGANTFYSVFAVTSPATNANNTIIFPETAGGLFFGFSNGIYRFGTTVAQTTSPTIGTNSISVGSFIGGLQVKRWANGTSSNAVGTINPPIVSQRHVPLRFGTYLTQSNAGLYHEVILYSNIIPDYDRAAVEEYLIKKWMNPFTTTITAPTDITGCTLWLDTSGGASNFTLSGNNVVKWNDKSGNNYDVSTSTATFPVWGDVSGYVYFNPGAVMNTDAPLPPTGAETAFVVGLRIGNAVARTLIGAQAGSTGPSRNITLPTGTNYLFRQTNGNAGLSSNFLYDSGISVTTAPGLLSWRTKNNEAMGRFAGQMSLYARDLSTTTNTVGKTAIGPAAHYYREIIAYNRTLTDTEMGNVEAYLINKWGLSNVRTVTTLQSNRPFRNVPAFMRFSEFPYEIGNCYMWLDAKDSNSLVLDALGRVLTWYDKSGWRNDISATGTVGPSYANQTVTFTSNRMRVRNPNNSTLNFRFDPELVGANHTFMALHKPASMTGNARNGNSGLFDFSVTGTPTCNISFPTTGSPSIQAGYTSTLSTGLSESFTTLAENSLTTEYNIITASIQSNRHTIYRNGVVQADVSGINITAFVFNVNNSANPTIATIGAFGRTTSNYYQGDVRELFIFNRALAPYEVAQMESYIAKKWSLTNLLPSNHIAFFNTPTLTTNTIPTGSLFYPAFWLDAMSYASTHSNGQIITTPWSNMGSQAVTVNPLGAPVFLSNAYGGRPGISLSNGSFLSSVMNPTLAGGITNYTLVVAQLDVSGPSTPATFWTCASYGTTASSNPVNHFFAYENSTTGTQQNRFSAVFVGSDGYTSATDTPKIAPVFGTPVLFENDKTNTRELYGYLNAVRSISSQPPFGNSTGTVDRLAIGTRSANSSLLTWPGKIYELISFAGTGTSPEPEFLFQVRAYLAHKWGLINSLPTYYPFKSLRP